MRRSSMHPPLALSLLAILAAAWLTCGPAADAVARQADGAADAAVHAVQWIAPSARRRGFTRLPDGIFVERVGAQVSIVERTATTTLDLQLRNPGRVQAEGVLLVPVPVGAVVTDFRFEGTGFDASAKILPREEARRIYDQIVRGLRDPALLEFVGGQTIRSSVFPIAPGATQKVRVRFEQVLEGDGQRVDYVLPRSSAMTDQAPWSLDVRIRAARGVPSVYSPTHALDISQLESGEWHLRTPTSGLLAPGTLQVSILQQGPDSWGTVFAHPDAAGPGGHFLFISGLPGREKGTPAPKREVTLVIDRSGSMAGEKMDQTRAAALQVFEALDDGERFNIIDYATSVSALSEQSLIKSDATTSTVREYIARLRAGGGTNIHAALTRAMAPPVPDGFLGLVLFMTDGLPTVGQTSEKAIVSVVTDANPGRRRVYSLGVGYDVNAPLLDRLADHSGSITSYVAPEQDVEVVVEQLVRRLEGPVLTDITFRATEVLSDGAVVSRVHDVVPPVVPDLFDGQQITVLGRYRGAGPIALEISGVRGEVRHTHHFTLDPGKARAENAFVPRIWAARQIAYLVDEVRRLGESTSGAVPPVHGGSPDHPRLRELTDEIIRLSAEYGVLTEYTAFLATEGNQLANWHDNRERARGLLDARAIQTRSGAEAVSQSLNFNRQKMAACVEDNVYWMAPAPGQAQAEGAMGGRAGGAASAPARLVNQTTTQLRQAGDVTLIQEGGRWVDGRLVAQQRDLAPDATIEFASPEWTALFERLSARNQGACLALPGDILLLDGTRILLVRNPDGC